MIRVLYVDACPRGEASRSRKLAEAFLGAMDPERVTVEVQSLPQMHLMPVDGETLAERERLCDLQDWEHPMFRYARTFQASDLVVIAAPYWDLSFPSMLKVWVEHMFIRNLTFVYRENKPVGLCRGRKLVYLTSAGSPIGENDWGYGYIRAVAQMLGIPETECVRAEGLDLEGADTDGIMHAALEAAESAGRRTLAQLSAS